jgi:P27 family predicted phage terminase small subunit
MARGRRPLPSTVKNLRGNPGKRGVNESEPQPEPGEPEMPEGLSAASQKKWHELLAQLRPMRVITAADGLNLEAICYLYDVFAQSRNDVQENGPQIKVPVMGRKGTPEAETVIGWIPKKNPAAAIANEALKTMHSYMAEVGLTPASRSKLHVEQPKTPDPADTYFERKTNAKHVN